MSSNMSDSLLRLIIGAVSGGALVLLFSTGLLPALHTNQGVLNGVGMESIAFAMLLGIVAGFVEQLVPSLLESQPNGCRTATRLPRPRPGRTWPGHKNTLPVRSHGGGSDRHAAVERRPALARVDRQPLPGWPGRRRWVAEGIRGYDGVHGVKQFRAFTR